MTAYASVLEPKTTATDTSLSQYGISIMIGYRARSIVHDFGRQVCARQVFSQQPKDTARVQEHHTAAAELLWPGAHLRYQAPQALARVHRIQYNAQLIQQL